MRVVERPAAEIESIRVYMGPRPADLPPEEKWCAIQTVAGRRRYLDTIIDFEGEDPPLRVKIPEIDDGSYVMYGVVPYERIARSPLHTELEYFRCTVDYFKVKEDWDACCTLT